MPTVPRVTPQVNLNPLPGARKSAAATFESLGGDTELARGRKAAAEAGAGGAVAGALGDVAGRVASVGAGVYEEMVRKERALADDTAVLGAENKLTTALATYQWGTGKGDGALNLKTDDAMQLPEEGQAFLAKTAYEIEQGLTTPEQKARFAAIRANAADSLEVNLRRHVFTQQRAKAGNELKAGVANDVTEAPRYYREPARFQARLDQAVAKLNTVGPQLDMTPSEIAQATLDATTKAHMAAIDNLRADGQIPQAAAWLEAAKDQIDPTQWARVKVALKTAGDDQAGLAASGEIWKQYGPKGDHDPIAIDQMETDARERFKDDPGALKATLQFLRERKAGVDAARADRKEAIQGALWGAVAKGATLAAIRQMPEYSAAPGDLQAQLSEHVVQQAEQRADRGYVLSGRAETEAGRRQQELERKNWAGYWEYSDPKKLSQMSDNQVLALTPTLGQDHVNRLMAQKRSITKSDETVRTATIDDELFRGVAEQAGLSPYKPSPSQNEKAVLGRLKDAVETEIDLQQQAKGKLLTRDEKRTVMQKIVDAHVTLDQWGRDPRKIAAIVNPEDQASAYVPVAEIPRQNLKEAINYLRSITPAYQRMTDAQIQQSAGHRIERSYAAKVLGLGGAEEIRRLKEGQ